MIFGPDKVVGTKSRCPSEVPLEGLIFLDIGGYHRVEKIVFRHTEK